MSRRCIRCGADKLVFPLHGVEKGGPIVCPPCAVEIDKLYDYERNVWLSRLGLKEKPRPVGPTYLTLELLADLLTLVHPDKHPPERAGLANRVTAALNDLRSHTPPAPKPPPPTPPQPVTDTPTFQAKSLNIRDMVCVDCLGLVPLYYCNACRQKWEEGHRKEREAERNQRRRTYARRRARELAKRPPVTCKSCGLGFRPTRRDAEHCSPACRQRAHRQRVTCVEAAQ